MWPVPLLILSLASSFVQVDESRVGLMRTFDPSSQCVEEYRYPRPGSENALSHLCLLEFSFSPSGQARHTHTQRHALLTLCYFGPHF